MHTTRTTNTPTTRRAARTSSSSGSRAGWPWLTSATSRSATPTPPSPSSSTPSTRRPRCVRPPSHSTPHPKCTKTTQQNHPIGPHRGRSRPPTKPKPNNITITTAGAHRAHHALEPKTNDITTTTGAHRADHARGPPRAAPPRRAPAPHPAGRRLARPAPPRKTRRDDVFGVRFFPKNKYFVLFRFVRVILFCFLCVDVDLGVLSGRAGLAG